MDRALAFEKEQRWQSARMMFDALRAAYVELPRCAPTKRGPTNLPLTVETHPAPSLVVDVAFGAKHDEAVAQEPVRTREVFDAL